MFETFHDATVLHDSRSDPRGPERGLGAGRSPWDAEPPASVFPTAPLPLSRGVGAPGHPAAEAKPQILPRPAPGSSGGGSVPLGSRAVGAASFYRGKKRGKTKLAH